MKLSEEYSINFLKRILEIYSPSRREEQLAHYIAEAMRRDLGFRSVEVDQVYNVTGEIGEGRPRILVAGHLDTVPGRMAVRIENGAIFGRGAVDAKAPLAALLLAASRMGRKGPHSPTIVAAALSDEEGSGMGARELIRRGIEADYAIFAEPSGIDNITIGYKGRLAITIICRTASVHASAPWMSVNAIEKAYEVWRALKEYLVSKEDPQDRYHSLSACLTKMVGGRAQNVLPSYCRFTVDIRIPPQLRCDEVLKGVEGILARFQSDMAFPNLEVKVEDKTEPLEVPKDSPVVRAFVRAILKVRDKRPALLYKTGTGDMNLLGHALKMPVITYGPGNSHMAHTEKERIDLQEYLQSIEVYYKAMEELKALHSRCRASY